MQCTAGIGEFVRHVDFNRVFPVDRAAGNFISDSLSNRPFCALDVSGQRVVCAGIVSEYDFDLRAVGKRLRNHHEGLRIGSKGLVRGSRSGFIQCLREIGGSIYIAPCLRSHVVGPLGIYIFQTDALDGTILHVIPAHEPDGRQGMVESKSHGSVGVSGQFSRLCHEKVLLVIDIAWNSDADGGRTGVRAAGEYVLPVVFRGIGEKLHFI